MNRGLLIALIATLAAVWYASGLEETEAPDAAAPADGIRSAAGVRRPAGDDGAATGVTLGVAREAAEVGRDLFARHSFLPPPPPAAPAGPPPAPTAPPLPFRYQGRMTEEGRTTVFLAQGERMLVAREGDLLNNQYRVESVTAAAVTFMFEPLRQRQTLTIGSAK